MEYGTTIENYRAGLLVELDAYQRTGRPARAAEVQAVLDALPAQIDTAATPADGADPSTTSVVNVPVVEGPPLTVDQLEGLDVDELRAVATAHGLEVDRRLGADKLREDLARQILDAVAEAEAAGGVTG